MDDEKKVSQFYGWGVLNEALTAEDLEISKTADTPVIYPYGWINEATAAEAAQSTDRQESEKSEK